MRVTGKQLERCPRLLGQVAFFTACPVILDVCVCKPARALALFQCDLCLKQAKNPVLNLN